LGDTQSGSPPREDSAILAPNGRSARTERKPLFCGQKREFWSRRKAEL
jgi:hypothetical protein